MAPFVCPFTGFLSNGVIKFVALKPCGHVMSQKAFKELVAEQGTRPDEKQDLPSSSSNASDAPHSTQTTLTSAVDDKPHSDAYIRYCPICQIQCKADSDVIILASEDELPIPRKSKEKKRNNSSLQESSEQTPSDELPPPSKKSLPS